MLESLNVLSVLLVTNVERLQLRRSSGAELGSTPCHVICVPVVLF